MIDWQPIETAPKDGTDVLVARDVASVWVVHIAWYRSWEAIQEYGDAEEWAPDDQGWWSYTRTATTQELLSGFREPTHWAPLNLPI